MSTIPNFVLEAKQHALKRKFDFQKIRLTPDLLAREVEVNMVLGEVGAAERILEYIKTNKNNSDFSIEDVEAKITLFISDALNHVSKTYHGYKAFPLERVLKAHGYYDKKD